MYLHVQVSEEEPLVYALDRDEITIGSNPSSDIYIDRKEISRKHLKVFREASDYFVVDQGSSNGSYIAGERLIPGKREPFFAASPVRLGSDVFISIARDLVHGKVRKLQAKPTTGNQENTEADKTRVISLKELRAQQAVQKKKKKKKLALRYQRMEKLKRKKQDQALIRRSLKIAVGFLILGFILQRYQSSLSEHVFTEKKRSNELIRKNFVVDIGDVSEERRVPREKLPGKEVFQELLTDEKCFSRKETSLCQAAEQLGDAYTGVIKANNDYLFFINPGARGVEEKNFITNLSVSMKKKLLTIQNPGIFYFVTFSVENEKPTLGKIYVIKSSVLFSKLIGPNNEQSNLFSEEADWRIY